MSIQQRIGCGLAIVLVATIQSARGADGRLNQDTLSQMGLGGLVTMGDAEAESVRGLGFKSSSAEANGSSYANINSQFGDAHSQNSYSASGKHDASGENESHAGVQHSSGNGGNWGGNGNGGNGNGNWGGNGNGGNGNGNWGGNGNGGKSHGNGGNNSGCNTRSCGNNGGGNSGCNNNRNCGNNGGNSHPGGGGGGGKFCGGGTVKVFAGGSSSARAH